MELIILIGIQASGKSTFYLQRFAETHIHISKDNFPNAKKRDRRQTALIETAFQAGRSVVVDNTNPGEAERRALIDLAQKWNAKVIGYFFEPQPALSIKRNQLRAGKRQVPDIAIYATLKRLEPPSYTEGFDVIHVVSSNQEGFFVEEKPR